MENVNFEPTQDSSIFAVNGLSTDNDLVQAIGAAATKPKGAKYYQFKDGVFAVIKDRGQDSFRLRAPRSTSSAPAARNTDPLKALKALEVEMAGKRAQIRASMEARIGELKEELRQAEESLTLLDQTH